MKYNQLNVSAARQPKRVGRGIAAGQGKTALVCRVLEAARKGTLPESNVPIQLDGLIYLSPNLKNSPVSAPNLFNELQKCLAEKDRDKARQWLTEIAEIPGKGPELEEVRHIATGA